jgi:L-cysteine S-thiosulfotransferase
MNRNNAIAAAFVAAAAVTACASMSDQQSDELALKMIRTSFRSQGIADVSRLNQDAVQEACSALTPPSAEVMKKLEATQLAAIKWPAGGRYLGDWKRGEALAQNGRGATWTDKPGDPNGGNCYNCHQIAKAEISYGTLGPSLYNYGKLRQVSDPSSPQSAAIVQYTWGKLWNAKAYNACSGMPRFGHAGVLTEDQIRDLMALLLDPKSPVNQ